MKSINVVCISGNVGRDGDLRQSLNGVPVLSFSIAVNERKRDPHTGEYTDVPNWIDCVVFGNFATAIAPKIVKGAGVAVYGRLKQSSWEQDDGRKRTKIEVVAETVLELSKATTSATTSQKTKSQETYNGVYDENIPF